MDSDSKRSGWQKQQNKSNSQSLNQPINGQSPNHPNEPMDENEVWCGGESKSFNTHRPGQTLEFRSKIFFKLVTCFIFRAGPKLSAYLWVMAHKEFLPHWILNQSCMTTQSVVSPEGIWQTYYWSHQVDYAFVYSCVKAIWNHWKISRGINLSCQKLRCNQTTTLENILRHKNAQNLVQ